MPVWCRNGARLRQLSALEPSENGLIAPLQTASNLIPSATLPQPLFPGFNGHAGSASEALDPHFRPNVSDSFNFTIQRQLTHRVTLEFGYIGRRITHEYQPIKLNAVPYMMTLGGQQFKQAYANLVLQYCGGLAGLAGGGCGGAICQPRPGPSVTRAALLRNGARRSHFCILQRGSLQAAPQAVVCE